jgi:succinate dehydrogenase / fumarate reductase, iron-sulfur subunit
MTAPVKTISLTLKIWRQGRHEPIGRFETYRMDHISTDMSFLEMLDILNVDLAKQKKEPVAFDHDCREGICGMCGAMVNGRAHGHEPGTTLCQLHMRHFSDNDTIVVEPWRARAFKVVKDLVVDRSTLDALIRAGGYISVNTGGAPDANTLPIPKEKTEAAFNAAACIGCGACVAACPNASAMLFAGAKISHLAHLPQGLPEARSRVLDMIHTMRDLGFGNCSNETECELECPKNISILEIARLNREFIMAAFS